jgi:hypothetical protein
MWCSSLEWPQEWCSPQHHRRWMYLTQHHNILCWWCDPQKILPRVQVMICHAPDSSMKRVYKVSKRSPSMKMTMQQSTHHCIIFMATATKFKRRQQHDSLPTISVLRNSTTYNIVNKQTSFYLNYNENVSNNTPNHMSHVVWTMAKK